MSKAVSYNIKAKLIQLEETINKIFETIKKYNLKKETEKLIIEKFNLNNILNRLKFTSDFDSQLAMQINNEMRNLNVFFNSIDTYLIYNHNLLIDEYQKKVEEMAQKFIQKDTTILTQALEGVESEIKRSYIVSLFNSNIYKSKNELLLAADEELKKSTLYKNELIINNLRKIEEIKKIKVEDISNISQEILSKEKEKFQEEVSEAVQRRVVSSILKIIKSQNFIIKRENVVLRGNEALIYAAKITGEEVRFKIDLSGKFIYKFHNYEGMSCEKDIADFEKLFQDVYSIEMEEKKVFWTNPDRISKNAFQVISNKKIGG